MADVKNMGTRDARAELGRLVDEAHFRNSHVILTKNEEPRAVLVPYAWWKENQGED
jgi:prevent-host-death family protein